MSAIEQRFWRATADVRRRLSGRGASPAAGFDVSPRRDLDVWHEWSSAHFERYRSEHPPAPGRVAVVCVSMRPELIDAVATDVAAQLEVDLELVFVANGPGFADLDLDARFRAVAERSFVRAEHGTSLGAALNLAMTSTSARFVAKFDDDDRYGAHHLVDSLRAHGYAGAGVVGKHTYYAEVDLPRRRLLRFPGNEFRYTSTLAGGTLVIDRERTGDLRFDDVSLGEDRAFIAACHRRGLSTFAADRFNFVQHRHGDNTWAITRDEFAVGTIDVTDDSPWHEVDR